MVQSFLPFGEMRWLLTVSLCASASCQACVLSCSATSASPSLRVRRMRCKACQFHVLQNLVETAHAKGRWVVAWTRRTQELLATPQGHLQIGMQDPKCRYGKHYGVRKSRALCETSQFKLNESVSCNLMESTAVGLHHRHEPLRG